MPEWRGAESWHAKTGMISSGARAIRELVITVAMAAAVFLLVQGTVRNYRVEGFSMEPALDNGELLLVSKLAYHRYDVTRISKALPFLDSDHDGRMVPFGDPRRGDVIVFNSTEERGRFLVKRVIGLPGDTVEIRRGVIFSNGRAVNETNLIPNHGTYTMAPMKLPGDQYWVMGDNRTGSSDSRTWGTLPRSNMVGKAWVSYWPAGHLGAIKAPRF